MSIKYDAQKIIKSFGLVFGDIGTSPIYTVTVIFLLLKPTVENIIGVMSLIFWTLTLLVTVEYIWLAMSLAKKGEGGTIVLKEVLTPLLKRGRKTAFVALLAYLGVSLLFGDGVITPAISILSAVEGVRLIPSFSDVHQVILMFVAAAIAVFLFTIQKKGTEKVAGYFGPIILVWLLVLAVSGLVSILQFPEVLKAINPYYAVNFMLTHGFAGFFVLSQVILCATGSEALFADMGHLGRLPIIRAWCIAFVALTLSYLGQGAFLALHPETKNILFGMVNAQAQILYAPFLLLSILATIIASQAMISGMFSIVYQGITTRIMPMFRVNYTSTELKTQIYIGAINRFLLVFVLFAIFVFKESANLASVYGLATICTMTITSIMIMWILYIRRSFIKLGIAIFVFLVIVIFFLSSLLKIPHGGYWSLIIASIPFLTILIYTQGQKKLYKALKPINGEDFLRQYKAAYEQAYRIRGSALFFLKDPSVIPPYIVNTMFCNNIIYVDNIFVSINIKDEPFGVSGR
ncbi:MAG: KUP/HAK/KT family potassium transporter, partial [Candidatus Gastranaerophilales bacterium]|nr:KUP/HAK/KT family potassium transporter [Candidatus Gastranaerophilales bacterium]